MRNRKTFDESIVEDPVDHAIRAAENDSAPARRPTTASSTGWRWWLMDHFKAHQRPVRPPLRRRGAAAAGTHHAAELPPGTSCSASAASSWSCCGPDRGRGAGAWSPPPGHRGLRLSQIGQVTASIGFTMISPPDTILEIVGRPRRCTWPRRRPQPARQLRSPACRGPGQACADKPDSDIEFFPGRACPSAACGLSGPAAAGNEALRSPRRRRCGLLLVGERRLQVAPSEL